VDVLSLFYRPSPKDIASGGSTWLKRYIREFAISASAAASITAQDTDFVGPDTVRLIEQVTLFWQPGAAQTSRSCVVWSSDVGGVLQGVLVGNNPDNALVAGAPDRHTQQTNFYMFQGDVLNAAATFSAGANANAFSVYLVGWEFPRGSLQR